MINKKKNKNNNKFKNILKISIFFRIIEIITKLNNTNIIYWKILYIFFIINKLIEYPYIIITHIILIYIYKKIYNISNIKNIVFMSCSILLLSLITKEIIKKNIYISRPYKSINIKKQINKKNIPKWIMDQWKYKNSSSFPSGHTIFTSYWIMLFWKKKKKNSIIILLLTVLTSTRIFLLLHRSQEIIFSFIINNISKYIINKTLFIYKYIKTRFQI